jgi:hypothetical protein
MGVIMKLITSPPLLNRLLPLYAQKIFTNDFMFVIGLIVDTPIMFVMFDLYRKYTFLSILLLKKQRKLNQAQAFRVSLEIGLSVRNHSVNEPYTK